MTKTKSTKRALVSSALALMMCISMLIGSTFAWFTDSVTSSSNKIQSGTLKLDLEMLVKNDDNTTSWKSIKEDKTALFNYTNWEPGYTDVKVLKVENEGSLALKWVAKFVAEKELSALANVIDVYVCPSETEIGFPADRTLAGYTRVGTVAEFVNTIEETTNGTLEAGKEAYLGIALKMQETAGNEYQGLDLGGAFDIQILATQYTYENDSFDNQYDKDAEYPTIVKTASELQNALDKGEDIVLSEKIEMDTVRVTIPQNTVVDIDLAGNELSFEDGTMSIEDGGVLNIVNTADTDVNFCGGTTSILMSENSTVNISDVVMDMQTSAFYTYGKGTINFNSGTIVVSEENAAPIALMFGSTFNMNGGEIIVAGGEEAVGIIVANGGAVINLNAGKIDVQEGTAIVVASQETVSINIAKDFEISCATNAVEILDPYNSVVMNDNRN